MSTFGSHDGSDAVFTVLAGAWGARLAIVGLIVGGMTGLRRGSRVVGRERNEEMDARTGGSARGAFASLAVGLLGVVLGYVTTQRPFTPGTSVVELLIPAGALAAGALGIAFGMWAKRRASKGEAMRIAATVAVVLGALVVAFAGFVLNIILLLCAPVGWRLVC